MTYNNALKRPIKAFIYIILCICLLTYSYVIFRNAYGEDIGIISVIFELAYVFFLYAYHEETKKQYGIK